MSSKPAHPSSVRLTTQVAEMVAHHRRETGEGAAVAIRSLIRAGFKAVYPDVEQTTDE